MGLRHQGGTFSQPLRRIPFLPTIIDTMRAAIAGILAIAAMAAVAYVELSDTMGEDRLSITGHAKWPVKHVSMLHRGFKHSPRYTRGIMRLSVHKKHKGPSRAVQDVINTLIEIDRKAT